MYRTGLVWLQHDLRLDDQPLIEAAARQCQQLLFVYCVPPQWFQGNRYGLQSMGPLRWSFLQQTLDDLQQQLQARGQYLLICQDDPLTALPLLIQACAIDALYYSFTAGFYECRYQQLLRQRYPFLAHHSSATATLWSERQLPFPLTALPESFSKFRRKVEQNQLRQVIAEPLAAPEQLPPPPQQRLVQTPKLPARSQTSPLFQGGSQAALQHLHSYFASAAPQHYKVTRNALDDWSSSTKFSPWLATGALSVRRLLHKLTDYERVHGSNDSTYWIFFELLWREYFYWYAQRHQQRLFSSAGIKHQRPTTSFYPSRFQQWCSGTTAYPIVNACMRQLNATGYMSNRGRQLVASCFVHELQLDWRYGAAYFEQQLLDYDVASNWGNWQYLAGVGADPRGHRRFDLAKQAQLYDPEGTFVARWQGQQNHQGDWLDAADWPVPRTQV